MMPPRKTETKPLRIVALADGRVVRIDVRVAAQRRRGNVVLRLVRPGGEARRLREAEVWSRLGLDEEGIRRQRARAARAALSIVRK